MLVYYVLLFLLFAGFIIKQSKDKRIFKTTNNNVSFIKFALESNVILFIYVLIIVSIRDYSVGVDLNVYENIWNEAKELSFVQCLKYHIEPGYMLLNWLVLKLTSNYSVLLFVVGTILYYSFIFSFKKYTSNNYLSLYLFVALGFFFQSMSMLRQYLALIILWHSFKYVINKNFVIFLLLVILATMFHYTAIIFIIVYPLNFFKFTWSNLIISVVLILTGVLCIPYAVKVFSTIIGKDYYYIYFVSNELKTNISMNYVIYTILLIGIFIYLLLMRKKILTNKLLYDILLKCYYISIMCRVLAGFFPSVSFINRVSIYFFISIIYLLPIYIENEKNKNLQLVLTYCVFIFGLISTTYVAYRSYNVLPYKLHHNIY